MKARLVPLLAVIAVIAALAVVAGTALPQEKPDDDDAYLKDFDEKNLWPAVGNQEKTAGLLVELYKGQFHAVKAAGNRLDNKPDISILISIQEVERIQIAQNQKIIELLERQNSLLSKQQEP